MNSNPPVAPAAGRVVAVDALRGFDMFWLIGGRESVIAVVGIFASPLPAGFKAQLDHVRWEGFSVWDMVMPLFLFIVGTAMPLSLVKRIESGQSKAALYRKILIRTALLFVFGMIVQGNLLKADLSQLHLYCNTLQAIAIGYLIASVAMLHLRVLGQILVAVGLLVGYWLLMLLVPVPGHGAGLYEENLNLALYIDKTVLGQFQDGTTYTWILSSMAFGATVLLGVFSGHLFRANITPLKRTGWFALIGLACLGLGWAWSQNALGTLRCPIIKHIFTSSMVLWSCGWCYLLLAIFYLVIDVLGYRRWTIFFTIIGSNAILAYMGFHLIKFRPIANGFVGGVADNLMASQNTTLRGIGEALGPLAAFTLAWLILWYLYRKGTFVRV